MREQSRLSCVRNSPTGLIEVLMPNLGSYSSVPAPTQLLQRVVQLLPLLCGVSSQFVCSMNLEAQGTTLCVCVCVCVCLCLCVLVCVFVLIPQLFFT